MWGLVTGDASTEARGNLMLAILARTFDNYFLMRKTNTNQPVNYIGNKVTGIVSLSKSLHVENPIDLVFSYLKTRSTTQLTSVQISNISRASICSPSLLQAPTHARPGLYRKNGSTTSLTRPSVLLQKLRVAGGGYCSVTWHASTHEQHGISSVKMILTTGG